MDEPDVFPPEFWELFLQSNFTALGKKCRSVCVGMTSRRLIAAGTMREWRPRMEEINLDARQYGFGVSGGVSGGVEHVAYVPEYTTRQETRSSIQTRIMRSSQSCGSPCLSR